MPKVIDLNELCQLPMEFAQTFNPRNIRAKGYPFWTRTGDSSAFFVLFMDNLATQLGLAGMAIGAVGMPAEFVWKKFFGGAGLSIFFGNLYYTMQASKVAMSSGKNDTCAQPYGINTPGAIAKTFGVLGPVFWATGDAQKAWETACVANFYGGLFEFIGAFIAPFLARNIPQPAFLVPIGGIGMTWLGISQVVSILKSEAAHNPVVGFLPFVIVWVSFFGSPKRGLFGAFIPAAFVSTILGVVLNLIAQTANFAEYRAKVDASTNFLKWNGLAVPGWSQAGTAFEDYGNLVLGLAFTNFIGTYACNISARKGGDLFPIMESMMVDGIGSMLGALFGSPYGTTVYIGHVAYKKMGATRGYSLLNGVLWLIIGLLGFHALLDAIIPHEIVSGILVVVGFSMAGQVMTCSPQRWYPAVLVGMGICFSDYIIGGFQVTNGPLSLLGNGYVWVSLFYSLFLMMLTDRWFLAAAGTFLAMSAATFIGLIHASKINLKYNNKGTIIGSEGMFPKVEGLPGWKLILTYLLSALMCGLFYLAQQKGYVDPPEEEDFRVLQEKEFQDLQSSEHVSLTDEKPPVEAQVVGLAKEGGTHESKGPSKIKTII